MSSLDPLLCTLFLVLAFVMAGFAQTFWLRSPISKHLAIPLDGGRRFGGKRILGDNKTWRGFVVMVPAVGLAFIVARLLLLRFLTDDAAGLWQMSTWQYGLLGCWVGLGFMIGELPNSFIKRQLGILPGTAPDDRWAKTISFAVDRLDSVVGGLVALIVVVPLPLLTWCLILLVGPVFHWSFNVLLFLFGVKARPA